MNPHFNPDGSPVKRPNTRCLAAANVVTHRETVMVPAVRLTTEVGLSLILTQKEAEDIARLCEHVGGDPAKTRGVFDRIASALRGAGIAPSPKEALKFNGPTGSYHGHVHFN